jgi:hypothetical protein
METEIWEAIGNAIGKRNTQLKEIISFCNPGNHLLMSRFLPGFVLNRSIQKVSIFTKIYDHKLLNQLAAEFFSHNTVKCLELEEDSVTTAGTIIQSFDSLEEFSFVGKQGTRVDDVLDALTRHTGLTKITLSHVEIGHAGCNTLNTLLLNAGSNLSVLHLRQQVKIDNEGMHILSRGLSDSSALKELDMSWTKQTLESLTTSYIGFQAVFGALQRSRSSLVLLNLGMNYVGGNDMDTAAASTLSLSRALLHHSATLKTLNLSCVEGLTSAGWNSIMQRIGDCALLENLDLTMSGITGDGLAALTNALVNNRSLNAINLSLIGGVSEAGWTAFSVVLRNPESVLEVIDLSCNSVNDEVMQSFSDALVNNTKLKEFNVRMTSISSNGFAAFTHLLCNSTSILTTYQSNHTIEELWKKDDDDYDDDDEDDESNTLPEDLMNLLRLNKENSPNEAARIKIINTHFSGPEINMQPFMDMALGVRPYAIAWMGRDNNLYRFLRAMPSLLEAVGGKVSSKKRARTEE